MMAFDPASCRATKIPVRQKFVKRTSVQSSFFLDMMENTLKNKFYCPQSFSGGGLYLKVKWLLWSVYDGLLWSVKREWVTLVYGLY